MLWVLIRIALPRSIYFCGEIPKIIPKLSSNTLLICSTDFIRKSVSQPNVKF